MQKSTEENESVTQMHVSGFVLGRLCPVNYSALYTAEAMTQPRVNTVILLLGHTKHTVSRVLLIFNPNPHRECAVGNTCTAKPN